MGPAEYYKKIAAVPNGPLVVKLTNSPSQSIFKNLVCHRFKGLFHPAKSPYSRGSPISTEIDINPTDFEFL